MPDPGDIFKDPDFLSLPASGRRHIIDLALDKDADYKSLPINDRNSFKKALYSKYATTAQPQGTPQPRFDMAAQMGIKSPPSGPPTMDVGVQTGPLAPARVPLDLSLGYKPPAFNPHPQQIPLEQMLAASRKGLGIDPSVRLSQPHGGQIGAAGVPVHQAHEEAAKANQIAAAKEIAQAQVARQQATNQFEATGSPGRMVNGRVGPPNEPGAGGFAGRVAQNPVFQASDEMLRQEEAKKGSFWNRVQPGFDDVIRNTQGLKGSLQRGAAGLAEPQNVALIGAMMLAGPELAPLAGRVFTLDMARGFVQTALDTDKLKEDPRGYYGDLFFQGVLMGLPHVAPKLWAKMKESGKASLGEKVYNKVVQIATDHSNAKAYKQAMREYVQEAVSRGEEGRVYTPSSATTRGKTWGELHEQKGMMVNEEGQVVPEPKTGEVKTNAVQKQGATQGVSRSQRPKVELQGVGEGDKGQKPAGTSKAKTEEVTPEATAPVRISGVNPKLKLREADKPAPPSSDFTPTHEYTLKNGSTIKVRATGRTEESAEGIRFPVVVTAEGKEVPVNPDRLKPITTEAKPNVVPTAKRSKPGSVSGEREADAGERVPARSGGSSGKAGAAEGATAPVQPNKVQGKPEAPVKSLTGETKPKPNAPNPDKVLRLYIDKAIAMGHGQEDINILEGGFAIYKDAKTKAGKDAAGRALLDELEKVGKKPVPSKPRTNPELEGKLKITHVKIGENKFGTLWRNKSDANKATFVRNDDRPYTGSMATMRKHFEAGSQPGTGGPRTSPAKATGSPAQGAKAAPGTKTPTPGIDDLPETGEGQGSGGSKGNPPRGTHSGQLNIFGPGRPGSPQQRVTSAVRSAAKNLSDVAGDRFIKTASVLKSAAMYLHTGANAFGVARQEADNAHARVMTGLSPAEQRKVGKFLLSNRVALSDSHPQKLSEQEMEDIWGRSGHPLSTSQSKMQAAILQLHSEFERLYTIKQKQTPSIPREVGMLYTSAGKQPALGDPARTGEDIYAPMLAIRDKYGNLMNQKPSGSRPSPNPRTQSPIRGSRFARLATGAAQEYSTDVHEMLKHAYSDAALAEAQANFFQHLKDNGLGVVLTKANPKPPETITYKGMDYPAVPVTYRVVKAGSKGYYDKKMYIPQQIAEDYHDMTSRPTAGRYLQQDPVTGAVTERQIGAGAAQKFVMSMQLASPRIVTGHAMRVLSLATGIRDPRLSKMRRAIDTLFAIPSVRVVPRLTKLYDLANLNMDLPENRQIRLDLARANALDNSPFEEYMGSNIPGLGWMKEQGHGALFAEPRGKGNLLKPSEFGLDVRVKVLNEKIRRAVDGYDVSTPAKAAIEAEKMRKHAYAFGEYVSKPSRLIEFMKKLNPYAGTSAPLRATEIKQLLGNTGMSGKNLSPSQRAAWKAESYINGVAGSIAGYILLNKLASGHYPWQNKEANTLELGNGYHITMSDEDPAATRAMTTLGLQRTANDLDTGQYMDIPKAVGKGVIGAAIDLVVGPGVRMIGTAAGRNLYLVDPNGHATMLAPGYPGAEFPAPGSFYDDDSSGKDTYMKRGRAILGELSPVVDVFADVLGNTTEHLSALRSPKENQDITPWSPLWAQVKVSEFLFNAALVQPDKEPKSSGAMPAEINKYLREYQSIGKEPAFK